MEQSNKTNLNDRDLIELQQFRKEVRVHLQKDLDFHIKQLRLNGYVYGNKSAAELVKQLECKTAHSRIPNMKMSLGNHVSNPKDIANCFSEFYSKLYNLQYIHPLQTLLPAPNTFVSY